MNISIIIPTCGRKTLARTLQSIQRAGISGDDEVIVVGDGKQPVALQICQKFEPFLNIKYHEHGPTYCFGNAQRDFGMRLAKKDLVAFMDDDDEYTRGAFSVVRRCAEKNPGKVLIFQLHHRSLGIVWKEKVFKEGIGSQMVVLPNVQERLSKWTCERIPERDYMGDFYFFRRTVDNWPDRDASIVWVNFVIAFHHMYWVQQDSIGEWEPIT
jgi:glycosyltransferase involved in cell wall biosynthesis